PRWLGLFTVGLATQQAIIALVRFSQGRPGWPRVAWWAIGVAQAAGLHALAFWLLDRERTAALSDLVVGAAGVALATAGFAAWERNLRLPDVLNARWWKQGCAAFAASATVGSLWFL